MQTATLAEESGLLGEDLDKLRDKADADDQTENRESDRENLVNNSLDLTEHDRKVNTRKSVYCDSGFHRFLPPFIEVTKNL